MKRKLRTTNHLRGLYRALIVVARSLGYKYALIPGDDGEHAGYPGQKKVITVGRDQSLTDKIITLSHEIGHALDVIHDPVCEEEFRQIIIDWDAYYTGAKYYEREKSAWCHAKTLLQNMGGYGAVGHRFKQIRKRCLSSYYRQMKRVNGNLAAD